MAKIYNDAEKKAKSIFCTGAYFLYKTVKYKVLESAKPISRGNGGETKTDLFILAIDEYDNEREFKLSIKLNNAAHAVNKMKFSTFNSIFKNSQSIKNKLMQDLQKSLPKENLIFFEKFEDPKESKNYKKGYKLTLGWVAEIEYKDSNVGRGLSINLNADQNFKNRVMSGSYSDDDKLINALVNNKEIKDSGIANFILKLPEDKAEWVNKDINYFANQIITIENYTKNKHFFLILKLVSFFSRKYKSKNIGNKITYTRQWETRDLIFLIDWCKKSNQLKGDINYVNTNNENSKNIGVKLITTLKELDILYKNFDETNSEDSFKAKIYDKYKIKC